MNREDRAKQFLAFDALKGLREELKRREENRLKENKKEITEERACELSQQFSVIGKGTKIKIVFFYNGHYIELVDVVQSINYAYKYLTICDNKILFSDVYDVQLV